jgi:hypothetical protein
MRQLGGGALASTFIARSSLLVLLSEEKTKGQWT